MITILKNKMLLNFYIDYLIYSMLIWLNDDDDFISTQLCTPYVHLAFLKKKNEIKTLIFYFYCVFVIVEIK